MLKFTIAILLVACLFVGACGKRGPVRPLEEQVPQGLNAASLLQRGDSLQLRWQMPQRNQDGTALTDLDFVAVERFIGTPDDFCAECPRIWNEIARVRPQLPQPAQRVRDLYLLSDRGARPGQTVYYRLTPRNKQGDAGLPLTLQQAYRAPLAAPDALQIAGHDRSIELRWQPVKVPDGATLRGYQIYRRRSDQPFSPLPTNRKPLETTDFSDFGLDNGRSYYYRIRSLIEIDDELLESLPSPEVSAIPVEG